MHDITLTPFIVSMRGPVSIWPPFWDQRRISISEGTGQRGDALL